jgi:hypothetical protein
MKTGWKVRNEEDDRRSGVSTTCISPTTIYMVVRCPEGGGGRR